ncbi:2-oxoacid:acceptor oxidoreductase family protein [Candidatus Gracilibacteria bacterium]|nr:2-oxoacid:acceptor oxidoreductase family protein [Candidatus Gracilibacteria bacterium]
MKNQHYSIRIAGPAGLGMHSIMNIVADTFASLGYEVLTDSEYQSIIKGGVNFYDVNISTMKPYMSRHIDVLISLNDKNILPNLLDLSDGGVIIASKKWIDLAEKTITDIRTRYTVYDPEITDKYENTYLLGILAGITGIGSTPFEPAIGKSFKRKGEEVVTKNLQILAEYSFTYSNTRSEKLFLPIEGKVGSGLIYGNKALSYGAIESGLDFFSAYPMTPASTVLTEIVNSKRVVYLQAEDEIAVMNVALGASFTGARSMVATSGGGFALMTEGLSFAAQAEFPIVAILSQRAGPSTGTPTYHEQSEILYALRPTFGGCDHVVLCPSTMEEGYYMAGQALNIAQKYQTTVIILTDKQFSEGKVTVTELKPAPIDQGKLTENPSEGFKRYELTDDGVSPYVRVGTEHGDFIATSYEHDEYGATTEEMDMKVAMTEKRAKKLENFYEKEGIMGYRVVNPTAKKMIVTLSFTAYTADAWLFENPDWGMIVITCLLPLDTRVRTIFESLEKAVFFESNYTGQLEEYMTKELGLKYIPTLTIDHRRRYDLLPFYMEDFESLKN